MYREGGGFPGGGAANLAEIFGTEQDKVNCAFYFKIGACRHGERCTRLHHKPAFSQTVIIRNMYQSKWAVGNGEYDEQGNLNISYESQEHFDKFYEDVYCELTRRYGPIDELNVLGNLGEHLIGNVYVKFRYEEDAEVASIDLAKRWYNGVPVLAELSPVTDFREACCRQFEVNECSRGGFCNFMHLRPISTDLKKRLDKRFSTSDSRKMYSRSKRRSPSFKR